MGALLLGWLRYWRRVATRRKASATRRPPPGIDNFTEYQAETALAWANNADNTGSSILVAFNDSARRDLTGQGLWDLTWQNNYTTLQVQPGYSTLGWAQYTAAGWQYRGKFVPPSGWNVGVDPSIAVDPYDTSLVVVSAIGRPNPPDQSQAFSGICLERSVDGGFTFPDAYCLPVNTGKNGEKVDLSTVAIGGDERIWVATEDDSADGSTNVRVFRSADVANAWNQFQEVTFPGSFTAQRRQPQLRADVLCATGDVTQNPPVLNDCAASVVLAVRDPGTSSILTMTYDVDAATFGPAVDWEAACGQTFVTQPIAVRPLQQFRQLGYSFDLGFDEIQRNRVLRLAATRTSLLTDVAVQVYEMSADGACAHDPLWSTDYSPWIGVLDAPARIAFQPSIDYEDKVVVGGDPNGYMTQWALGWLDSAVNDPRVVASQRPALWTRGAWVMRTCSTDGFNVDRTLFPLLGSSLAAFQDPDLTCSSGSIERYWGDYFGVKVMPVPTGQWGAWAAFSQSLPVPPDPLVPLPACTYETNIYARPLHVAASFAAAGDLPAPAPANAVCPSTGVTNALQ